MNIEAPTFNALNKPQKRALILRDQLRFLDPCHLDSFLEGVSDHEPPTYTKLNGVIKPELAFVTLKEEATYFDLGNVLLSEDKNALYRVYLVAENDQIQMRMEDPLLLDDDVLDSLPIHGFIARGMIPLFKEKFQAIKSKMNKINGARQAAYNMANKTSTSFHEGENYPKPNPYKTKHIPTAPPSKASTKSKPKPNHEVKQHTSNKRKRTEPDTGPKESKDRALGTISEETKGSILDTIPSAIKISLFNTIVYTAFPHFDNVITASRNVVSTYSACSSEITALHCSIVDLRRVLQDFEEGFGKHMESETTLRYSHDLEGSSRGDEATRTRSISANNKSSEQIPRQSDNSNGTPPTTLRESSKAKEINNKDSLGTPTPASFSFSPASPGSHRHDHHDHHQHQLEKTSLSPPDSDPDSIPHVNPRLPPSTPTSSPHLRNPDPRVPHTSITALHHESVLRFQSSNNTVSPRRGADTRDGQAKFLGDSLLGTRKMTGGGGLAPVVNMLPCMRRKEEEEEQREKEGGDVGVAGDGDVVRS